MSKRDRLTKAYAAKVMETMSEVTGTHGDRLIEEFTSSYTGQGNPAIALLRNLREESPMFAASIEARANDN